MRILFLTPTPPDRPDRDGMTQVAAALIRQLGQQDQVDVWSLTNGVAAPQAIPGARQVRVFPRQPMSLLQYYLRPRRWPFFMTRNESPALHTALQAVTTASYDCLVIHSPFVMQYVLDAHIPVVAHVIDAMSDWFPRTAARTPHPFRRAHLLAEGRRAGEAERTILPHCRALVTVGEADAMTIKHAAPNTPVEAIPIGLDETVFFPPTAPRDPATIIMTGIMNYPPNVDAAVWFTTTIWPSVLTQNPAAQLRIVGRDPAPAVLALAQQPNVTVTGRVPSMATELQRATFAVSPLRFGTGYKIKVNEALACGTPLIASTSSISGVGLTPGRDCIVPASDADWVASCQSLLNRPEQRQSLSQAALAFAATRHWPAIAARYRQLYAHAIST